MPYKDKEAHKEIKKAYSKKHYDANKTRYNPGRKNKQVLKWKFWGEAHKIRMWAQKESEARWVAPFEIMKMCQARIPKGCGRTPGDMFNGVIDGFKREYQHGVDEVGLFMGKPTFSIYGEKAAFEEFKEIMPKRKRNDCKAELTILALRLKIAQGASNQRREYLGA